MSTATLTPEATIDVSALKFDLELDVPPLHRSVTAALVGELGWDAAWSKPDPARARALGYHFFIGYLSYDASKDWSAPYVQACINAGIELGFVWETTANRTAAGFQAGVADAQEANRQADALGVPKGTTIFYATDFDASPDQVRPYYQGAGSVGVRSVSGYGGIRVVDPLKRDGTIKFGWQTVAWSGGVVSQLADVYQRITPTLPSPGGSIDENVALTKSDAGWLWTPGAVAPAPPPPPPAPTPAVPHAADGNIYTFMGQDGGFGPITIKGTQWRLNFTDHANLLDDGDFGFHSKVATQHHVNVAADGNFGPISTRALQVRVGGTRVDGAWGNDTTLHLQMALNQARF